MFLIIIVGCTAPTPTDESNSNRGWAFVLTLYCQNSELDKRLFLTFMHCFSSYGWPFIGRLIGIEKPSHDKDSVLV